MKQFTSLLIGISIILGSSMKVLQPVLKLEDSFERAENQSANRAQISNQHRVTNEIIKAPNASSNLKDNELANDENVSKQGALISDRLFGFTAGLVTVMGTIRYADRENHLAPARFTKVTLMDYDILGGDDALLTTYTDSGGYFEFIPYSNWDSDVSNSHCGISLDDHWVNIAPQPNWLGFCDATIQVNDSILTNSDTLRVNVIPPVAHIYLPFTHK